jgi:hypothetical protein
VTEAAPGDEPRRSGEPATTSELERELREIQQELAEERRQREQLERELEAQRQELDHVESEQEELLSAAEILGPPEGHSWRDEKRGLGAGLTVTGLVSLVVGIVLHFAGPSLVIESNAHLGYFFGLVGIMMFLIGFILVW